MSLLAYMLLGIIVANGGRDEFHSLWSVVDTNDISTPFEEVERALKELQDAGHIEPMPGWEFEYRLREQAA